jgi:prepilin-type N-terminal cleavage/methylation domain-containing protein/prepilin-type processing-associated H-X9-DG protein
VRNAYTLVELLVVLGIIAILAALLFPAFAQSKAASKRAVCLSNLRQVGFAFLVYESDHDERMPDRRDLKLALPGGYRPWTTWPPSDPRAGWAAVVLGPYLKANQIWKCPGTPLSDQIQVAQSVGLDSTNYWLWRFDRTTVPIPLDDFWGKTESQCVADLQTTNDPLIGYPTGASMVELAVDAYFPKTVNAPKPVKGITAHYGGRNRLFLDGHAQVLRDARTPS